MADAPAFASPVPGRSAPGAPASGSAGTAHGAGGEAGASVAAVLLALEAISRLRPDRVLRLRGRLPGGAGSPAAAATAPEPGDGEPFELLIFRGFSSLTTHPTGHDPDSSALPEGSVIEAAELLQGPLDPSAESVLEGPLPPHRFLEARAWG